jgi:hypothetical protein
VESAINRIQVLPPSAGRDTLITMARLIIEREQ